MSQAGETGVMDINASLENPEQTNVQPEKEKKITQDGKIGKKSLPNDHS